MTAPSTLDLWGTAARDAALMGLKLELDGLTAIFQGLALAGVVPRGLGAPAAPAPQEEDDLPLDNLPL